MLAEGDKIATRKNAAPRRASSWACRRLGTRSRSTPAGAVGGLRAPCRGWSGPPSPPRSRRSPPNPGEHGPAPNQLDPPPARGGARVADCRSDVRPPGTDLLRATEGGPGDGDGSNQEAPGLAHGEPREVWRLACPEGHRQSIPALHACGPARRRVGALKHPSVAEQVPSAGERLASRTTSSQLREHLDFQARRILPTSAIDPS
jgi:hypothetical protein